ncbi:prolyl oligopeptidase family serine peptidase [Sphingomonas immobilis]|uniref:prolyl oligopeptidase n=1 Tax=Sphingomonas immobilis TaxID=3063997 RepID=A0ABT8ZXT4_9SPHN|nr:prolyl oligopeptidase family serine peptidase [Sphingomonas sp. CA1-15]MDO7842378.1 prolyl oligopeptidase family serine peptidase [Sphingomonas sp. CA1-15]
MRRALPLIAILLATPAFAQTGAPMHYPETRKVDQVDTQFGVKVADPYRWLENDVRTDPAVKAWVDAEVATTSAYLDTLPGRDILTARLNKLLDYERFGVPVKKGARYFYTRNAGLQNQSVLYVRDGLNGAGRVLIDPNGWSKDGATALAEWVPSEDGSKMLYSVQDGGTDWRTVKVLDVASGQILPDTVEWVKFSNFAWAKDGSGFYYSRFPVPADGQKFQALNENQKIYFHRIGTQQSADTLIYETPDTPKRGHSAQVTDDGKYLVITTTEGTDTRYAITVIDLTAPRPVPRTIFKALDNEWALAGNIGANFYWRTDNGAPRQRIVATNLNARSAVPPIHEVVPEDKTGAVLQSASIHDGKLIAEYLVDVKSELRRYALDGASEGAIALPGIGAIGGISGDETDPELFYTFTSFATPTTIYRYDVKTGKSAIWVQPEVAFDPAAYTVEQRFYASKDGTKVPMFVVRRKDVTGPAPTLLYAYGGFNISVTPAFSAGRLAWLEQGGVLAVANIRGGGEYGKAWHDGGRLANKQNVFDDFIAAGEYLKAQGITSKGGLAIQGGSNGGLLVGAVTNQRPDLFAAALPAVGVMDMLRFDRFTAGRYWVDDYGYSSKEADFRTLYAYSPYHNIRSGTVYPAILIATADTDDRVVPGHSFKYAAAVQAADIGPKPHLIRIETRAGHGSGKPIAKVIAETADEWAFAAKWTGLAIKPIN